MSAPRPLGSKVERYDTYQVESSDYEYVIQCITAVSGYVNAHGEVVKLVEKLKFSPPALPGQ